VPFRRLGVLTAMLVALSVPVASASAAPAHPAPSVLAINGTVSDPASYTLSQLAALPTETVPLPRRDGQGTVLATGVSLDLLVAMASPVLPAVKNALLRVIVTASGPGARRVSFALGELDPASATTMSSSCSASTASCCVPGRRWRCPATRVRSGICRW
jgi:hypothetical protein